MQMRVEKSKMFFFLLKASKFFKIFQYRLYFCAILNDGEGVVVNSNACECFRDKFIEAAVIMYTVDA